jgi:MerR family mercuric resistance operon transcriptional regulator
MPRAKPFPATVTRGQLAIEAGCSIETIRYYEQIGLMPPPERSARGYRLYSEPGRRRLRFILRARELGFAIEASREFLRLVDGDSYNCGEVQALTLSHVDEIRAKIADLQRLEATLSEIADRCSGGDVPDCPIIDALLEA